MVATTVMHCPKCKAKQEFVVPWQYDTMDYLIVSGIRCKKCNAFLSGQEEPKVKGV